MAMRCHYAVLSLDLNATTEDIKKAYRKLALRWHPDKNPENREVATKEFLLVQQAYEVLVDTQERAWYDKHRESILRGGLGKGDRYEDNSLNLFFYFRASCYKGYGDDSQGFYEVYANVFKQIFEEEIEFFEQTPDTKVAPEFGNSGSTFEEIVRPFYNYWEGYCTAKSYVWVEKYDTRDASFRMERRHMEQENKRLRNKARKERNEEVRALVAFIKKRDPRVQEYNRRMQEKLVERNKLAEERRLNEKKKRLEGMQQYKESEWSSFSTLSSELERLERAITAEFKDEDDESDEDIIEEVQEELTNTESGEGDNEEHSDLNDLDSLYCIACDKTFKSEKTMENHKKSKKHLVNAAILIEEMKSHDAELLDEVKRELCSSDNTQPQAQIKKSKKKKKKNISPEESPDIMDSEIRENQNDIAEWVHSENGLQCLSTGKEQDVLREKTEKTSHKTCKSKDSDGDFTCNVCRASYQTRNKLFDHIKSEGHALKIEHKDPPKANSKKDKTKRSKH